MILGEIPSWVRGILSNLEYLSLMNQIVLLKKGWQNYRYPVLNHSGMRQLPRLLHRTLLQPVTTEMSYWSS